MKNGSFLHDMRKKSTLVDYFSKECRKIYSKYAKGTLSKIYIFRYVYIYQELALYITWVITGLLTIDMMTVQINRTGKIDWLTLTSCLSFQVIFKAAAAAVAAAVSAAVLTAAAYRVIHNPRGQIFGVFFTPPRGHVY